MAPATGSSFRPGGVAVDGWSRVYVADVLNNRYQKFSKTGGYLTQWEGYGTVIKQFNHPYGVAVDALGYVCDTDSSNNRIQKFDSNGVFCDPMGELGLWYGPIPGARGLGYQQAGEPLCGRFGELTDPSVQGSEIGRSRPPSCIVRPAP